MQGVSRKRARRADERRGEVSNGHANKRCAAAQEVVFQLLCPGSKVGHIIGKGGATIEQLRQSTRANIKVERETQGCLDRLICISSAAAPAQPLCPAQDALFCVQDRLNGLDSSEACLTARLLIAAGSIGAVLGKKGERIAELCQSSGASITVHDSHEVPACGHSSDTLVTLRGERTAFERALRDLSSILRLQGQDRPCDLRAPAYNITAVATLDVQRQPPEDAAIPRHAEPCLAGSFRGPDAADLAHQGCRMSLPGHSEARPPMQPVTTQFRCLVPASDVGHVIGRKGETVQSLRDRSGATIKVHEGNSERKGMDRVVTLSCSGPPGPPGCPAQHALSLICQTCFAVPGRPQMQPVRLLVPAEQVGAVLGKGGCTITQIRADSGATVRLVALETDEEKHLPKDVSSSGQHRVIAFAGSPDSLLRAITAVTDILQDFQARSQSGAGIRANGRPPIGHMGPSPMGCRAPGAMPFNGHARNGAYASSSGSPYDSSPSRGEVPYDTPYSRHSGGCQEQSSRFKPATVLEPGKLMKDVRLIGVQVGCVIGKSGENINQIRKISGAMVKMSDAPKGVSERMLRLTGFPEQVQAAMNLVQAFLLAGGAGSLDQAAALTYSAR